MTELKRSLGLWQCVFLGVGSILGAGIYVLLGRVAGLAGNMSWVAFSLASVTALLTAFSYAELSSMFPRAGGEFVYARQALGAVLGLCVGLIVSTNGMITAATVALGFAGYLEQLVSVPLLVGACGILALMFALNIVGIRASSGVNVVLTIIEFGGLCVVIAAALPMLGSVNYLEPPEQGFNGIFLAAALAFFAYVGFEEIVKLAEETKNPERTIPRALFISGGVVTVVYIAIAILAVSALPVEELAKSKAPMADIVTVEFGAAAAIGVAIAALFSTSNTVLSNMLGSSRVLLDMGREARPLRMLGYVLPNRKTPAVALVLVLCVCAAVATIGDIGMVAEIATFSIFLTFLCVNACLIVLRVRQPDTPRPYRIPGNVGPVPVATALAIVMTLILLGYNTYAILSR
ncbi:putative amino acid permease YhdG [Planctomycetaceae bacterium]|nr:putative amino acid permease YhdG [Planctomycetaceae bacterium]